MVGTTGFEPAASASRTQRSTKLSHASTSMKFSTTKCDLFRICGFLCGRCGIYRIFLNTVPPIKWLFVRGCCSSASFRPIARYMLPNAALYQTEPHLEIFICAVSVILFYCFRKSAATQLTLAVPEISITLERCEISTAAPFRSPFICRRQRSNSKLPN